MTQFGSLAVAVAAFALVSAAVLPARLAHAQAASRTFVSGHGVDSGSCGPTAPCRSFSYAHSQTDAGGEITVLDPAGYGSVTITKALSIVNDGVGEAGVTTATSGANGITIAAGPNDAVTLEGLTLVGSGIGNDGVLLNSAGSLIVQNCVIRGFANIGIALVPNNGIKVYIADTTESNSGSGIVFQPTTGAVGLSAFLSRVQAFNNTGYGFYFDGANEAGGFFLATVVDSAAVSNTQGFRIESLSTGMLVGVTLYSSQSVNNGTGVYVGENASAYLAQMLLNGNNEATTVGSSGLLYSYGDNYGQGNFLPPSGVSTATKF